MEEKIIEIMAVALACYAEEMTPETELVQDLEMDSLDRVELTMAFEEQLLGGSEIKEGVAEQWRTVKDVVDTVMELVDEQRRAKKPALVKGGK